MKSAIGKSFGHIARSVARSGRARMVRSNINPVHAAANGPHLIFGSGIAIGTPGTKAQSQPGSYGQRGPFIPGQNSLTRVTAGGKVY